VEAPQREGFLLIVVDEERAVRDLAGELATHHIDVVISPDPAEALVRIGSLRPDAVLAAADLNPIDSPTVVRALRKELGTPVLLGVGDGDGDHAAAALMLGATACVARPYRPREVLPILRSIRPDTLRVVDSTLAVGGLRLDPASLEAHLFGRPIPLPMRECRLLQMLMLNAGRVVTREQIKVKLWGSSDGDASNSVTVHIQRLRSRLGDDPQHPVIIQTVRGLGYRLRPPSAAADGRPSPGPDAGPAPGQPCRSSRKARITAANSGELKML
jgi:DNA-binding response OmpR family regulator